MLWRMSMKVSYFILTNHVYFKEFSEYWTEALSLSLFIGQAASVFTQAQAGGKAMINKYPFEHAELYVEQLLRSDPMIFCDLEEEERMGSGK